MASDSHDTDELEARIRIFQEIIENLLPEPGLYMPILFSKENYVECEGDDHKT